MTNLQGWIWLISLVVGAMTIMASLEIPSFGFFFLIAGFMTITFLLDKIHKLETKIAELQQPHRWD